VSGSTTGLPPIPFARRAIVSDRWDHTGTDVGFRIRIKNAGIAVGDELLDGVAGVNCPRAVRRSICFTYAN
jgi:hypothetical protein